MRPEEGLYNPKDQRIDIYFNIERKELLHTLLHEFGHALGLGHLENENAIMYPFTTQEITLSPEDIAAITKQCEKHHVLAIALDNFLFLYQTIIEHNK